MLPRHSEIESRTDFSFIRYGQCWEDADVLSEALSVNPGDVCLSICSAGDNSLALLADHPGRVIALDMNPAQLACLELRVAAYRNLGHDELLGLIGSRPHADRQALYARCRSSLSRDVRRFWDSRPRQIAEGIGHAGKFERFFSLFRRRILPLIHSRRRLEQAFSPIPGAARKRWYRTHWNNLRWRSLFRLFFSRFVLGTLGRDPSFFEYVEGDVSKRILRRIEHAMTELDPSANPYLHWIVFGRHGAALPKALRREHFETIRDNLDRLEWHRSSLEDFLKSETALRIDRFNLSDIFEYMSEESCHRLLRSLSSRCRSGGRLVYWNMLVPRRRPPAMANELRSLDAVAAALHRKDKACFYSRLVVEERA